MGFKANLKCGVTAICIVSTAAPAGFAETARPAPVAAEGPLNVRVAQANDFSHIEFRFPGARISSRRDGQKLILRFSRYAKPDMTRLRVDPPKWLKTAEDANVGGALELTLTLADGADAKVGEGDGATFINLFKAKDAEAAKAAAANAVDVKPAPPPATVVAERPSPIPDGGVVKMQATMANGQVMLRFAWKRPPGAAVFRRGDAIWVVFDAPAKLDLSAAPHGFRQVTSLQAVQGADYVALRIGSPADVSVAASAEGPLWTIVLAADAAAPAQAILIARDEGSSAPALTATMAGATKVVWLDDPVVGDRIAVVTALAPSKGLAARQTQFRRPDPVADGPGSGAGAAAGRSAGRHRRRSGEHRPSAGAGSVAPIRPRHGGRQRAGPAATLQPPRPDRFRQLVQGRRSRLHRSLRCAAGRRRGRDCRRQGRKRRRPHGPGPLPDRFGIVVRSDRRAQHDRERPSKSAGRRRVSRAARRGQGDGRSLQGG